MIDFLELLAICLLQFPILIGMGLSMECGMGSGCDCVVAGSVVCSRSICSNGGPLGTPTQYQVDASGFTASANCPTSDCASLDGAYSFTIPAGCSATASIAHSTKGYYSTCGSGCLAVNGASPNNQILLNFNATLGIIVAITTSHSPGFGGELTNNYRYVYNSSAVDCSALSAFSIPFSNTQRLVAGSAGCDENVSGVDVAACNGSGVSVTVTTV